jgi:MscS family membrane protein
MKYLNISFLLFSLLLSGNSFSADKAAPTLKEIAEKKQAEDKFIQELTDAPKKGPYDEFDRSTPRSSLLALSAAIKDKDYERAVNFLDLRNTPFAGEKNKQVQEGAELVKQLAVVARRAMTINLEEISNEPQGVKDDGLPSYRDRITTLKTRDGQVDILMQRVPRGDGVFIWKISNATVALIPKLNSEFGYGLIGEKMSQVLPNYNIGAFELWQIVLLTGLLLIGLIISYLITFILGKLIQKAESFNKQRVQKFIFGPLRLLIVVLFIRATFDLTAPSLVARAIFEAKTLFIIAILWVLMGVIDLVIFRLAERMKRNGQNDAVVLLKPISTTIKLVIVLLAIITWMNNLGYEVTALLAGLGVGGIAVALAAQKSLENLIGSIIIYTSQPVKVGDFCQFGDIVGTVEEIGLRATQLRTLSRTVVHVPNALFAAGTIENLTQRDKILYRTRLRLSYKDTPDQVEQVLAKIRELIEEHKFLDEENSRVRFLEFGEYAQELELFAYIKTRDFAEYLEHREDVNLKINKILESVGVELVVPTRSIALNSQAEGLPVSK